MKRTGFTLIEIAIVLVVAGLILGMVFKGRELIASAKVKNTYASYNKILAGMNTFLERYGFYPGDGCPSTATIPSQCTSSKDGLLSGTTEVAAFFPLLINTQILSNADIRPPLSGEDWSIYADSVQSWIYANGTDLRLICDLDRIADDGNSNKGIVRANYNGNMPMSFSNAQNWYNTTTDCWTLTGSRVLLIKILP